MEVIPLESRSVDREVRISAIHAEERIMFKMRVLSCAFFLIVAAVPVSAQTVNATSGWVWQNPWPQGNNLTSVFMLDSQHIFAGAPWGSL
jgi:hypothetical protein